MSKMYFFLVILNSSVLAILAQSNSQSVASANNDAAVTIYDTLKNIDSSANIVCSPLSISAVLSLVLVGAVGKTATEMSQTLGYSKLTQPKINSGYHDLLPSLSGNSEYDLKIANSVWLSSKITALTTYKSTVTDDYYSEVNSLDPTDPAKQINNWVNNKTSGLIPTLFETLDPNVLMVLVNAIYFKGSWVTPFQTFQTQPRIFYTADGTSMPDQMNVISHFNYYESSVLNAQIVQLPYKGNNVSMIIVLPRSKMDLDALETKLKYSDLSTAIDKMNSTKINLTIPKFKTESSFPLNDPLMSLGIKEAFTGTANFSGITETVDLKISTAIQKAIIEIDENGTKAAAATGIGLVGNAFNPVPETVVDFNANHPFMYILYHSSSQSTLFWGRIVKP